MATHLRQPIDVLYSTLATLAGTSGLIPDQKYRITDFRTTELIVHSNPLEYMVGAVEEKIIVTAITSSELSKEAESETYPQDIIHYELAPSHRIADSKYDKGQIIYREDTANAIIGYFDWRECKILLWSDPTTDAYVWHIDQGTGDSQEFLIVPPGAHGLTIEADLFNRAPKICLQGAEKVWIGPQQDLVVFAAGAQDVSIGSCVRYAFHGTCAQFNSSSSANQSARIDFWGKAQNVDVFGYVSRTIFQGDIEHCSLGNFHNTSVVVPTLVDTLPHYFESIGPGGLWSVTYDYLANTLVANSLLIPGQKYRITDFRTRHTIPNVILHGAIAWDVATPYTSGGYALYETDVWQALTDHTGITPVEGTDWTLHDTYINEGATEAIVVTAATTSTLSHEATSETYPQDIINYELVCSHGFEDASTSIDPAADRGWIYYREDILKANSVDYDFRVVMWRRWIDPAVEPFGDDRDYNVLTDNTEAYKDFLTFTQYASEGNCGNHFLRGTKSSIQCKQNFNNVFHGVVASTSCDGAMYGNTFLGQAHQNELGVNFQQNLIGNGFTYNRILDNFRGNTVGTGFSGNRVGIDCTSSTFGNSNENNTFLAQNQTLHIGDNCFANHIYTNVSVTLPDDTTNVQIGSTSPWPVTYQQLSDMVTALSLIPGQKYRITDFRTRKTINSYTITNWDAGTTYTYPPNAEERVRYNDRLWVVDIENTNSPPSDVSTDWIPDASGVLVEGDVEPLIVTAISTTKLDKFATSEIYPQDIIHYDLVVPTAMVPYQLDAIYGRISYREDTYRNLSMYQDWRVIKFRVGETAPASGIYAKPNPIIGVDLYQDFYTFDTTLVGAYSNIHVGRNISGHSFVVFQNGGGETTIGDQIDPCIFVGYAGWITIPNCSSIICYGSIDGLRLLAATTTVFTGSINTCSLITNTPSVVSGDHSFENYDVGRSTFKASMDINMGSDMMAAAITVGGTADKDIRFAGIVTLLGGGGEFTISSLLNFNANHPVTFIAEAGYTFTFVHTLYEDITLDGQIMGIGNIVLDGNKGDRVTLEKIQITNLNGTFMVLVRRS